MNFLKRKKMNENVLFKKLSPFLGGLSYIKSLRRVFFVGSIVYNEDSYLEIIKKQTLSDLILFIKTTGTDISYDCLEVYLLEDNEGNYLVLYVLDFYEYMSKERILKISSIVINDVSKDLDDMEIIYLKE